MEVVVRFVFVPKGYEPKDVRSLFEAVGKAQIAFARHSDICAPIEGEQAYAVTHGGRLLPVSCTNTFIPSVFWGDDGDT